MNRLAPLIATLGLLIASPAGFAGKSAAEALLVPDTGAEGRAVLEGNTWTEDGGDYTIRLQRLDEAQRLAYIQHATGLGIDPFASPPDRVPGFLSFVLQIENRGEGPISFNPQTCWLVSNRKRDLQAPFGIDQLSFEYAVDGGSLPPAYRKAAPALFEHARSIPPGQSISGLLIYKAIHPKTRWFHVDAVISLSSGDIVRFSAPYRRVTKKMQSGRRESGKSEP